MTFKKLDGDKVAVCASAMQQIHNTADQSGADEQPLQIRLSEDEAGALRDVIGDSRSITQAVTLKVGDGHSGFGLYAWSTEYPEDGAWLIKSVAAPIVATVTSKSWPFIESPSEFATRMSNALIAFNGNVLAACRNVLIEEPPTFAAPTIPAPAVQSSFDVLSADDYKLWAAFVTLREIEIDDVPLPDLIPLIRQAIAQTAPAVAGEAVHLNEAILSAVAAIYFDDSSDYKQALYSVVRWLSDDIYTLLLKDLTEEAFEKAQELAAPSQGAKQ